jgi:hypothetical protein
MERWREQQEECDSPAVVLETVRVSRRDRDCAGCTGKIRKGQAYRRFAIPPEVPGDRWFVQCQHADGGCEWWA